MEHGPPPPPITIVDPNAPAGTADLLGSDHQPWRPSRTQVAVGGTVLLVAVLVGGVVALVRHSHHERALDAASAKAVAFFVDTEDTQVDDGTGHSLGIINEGPATVRVLDVGLVGDGYPAKDVDADLPAYQTLSLNLPLGTACPTSLLDGGPTGLRVRARTTRGTVVTRVVPLDPNGLERVASRERDRCKLLRVDEAIGTGGGGSSVLRADRLEVDLVLVNNGKLPVTISAVRAADGVRAQVTGLPLRIPGRVGTGETPSRTLHVVLTVTSCEPIRAALLGQPTFVGEGYVLSPTTLALTATNPYRQGTLFVAADANDFQPFQDERPQLRLEQLMRRRCPHLPFYEPMS